MKISKLFLFVDHEERWLNDMAVQGYRFIGKSGLSYEFKAVKNNTYRYMIDQRGFLNDNDKFVQFLNELNYKLVKKQLGFYYFETNDRSSTCELYTDKKSKMRLYARCLLVSLIVSVINISIIHNANGPLLFNVSIPILVNSVILCAAFITSFIYIRAIFLLRKKDVEEKRE